MCLHSSREPSTTQNCRSRCQRSPQRFRTARSRGPLSQPPSVVVPLVKVVEALLRQQQRQQLHGVHAQQPWPCASAVGTLHHSDLPVVALTRTRHLLSTVRGSGRAPAPQKCGSAGTLSPLPAAAQAILPSVRLNTSLRSLCLTLRSSAAEGPYPLRSRPKFEQRP